MAQAANRPQPFGVDPLHLAAAREPGDDFFCRRYQVWYRSLDCAIRTYFRSCRGCLSCEQGRFNLRRHEVAVRLLRSTPPRGCD